MTSDATRSPALSAYANRRMAVLLGLGFASGLPLALTGATLSAWLTRSGLDMASVGLFGAVGIPYALKFAWAPLLDRYAPPFLGRRRGWLLLAQVLVACAIAAMGIAGASVALPGLAALAVLVAFLSASQDIVADAYRTDVLEPSEYGPGASVFTTGYRLGMIATTGGALILAGNGFSWSSIYLGAAALMSVGVAATLAAPEPARTVPRPASLGEALRDPLRDLVLRRSGPVVLAFVMLFKLPDVLAQLYATPFLQRTGYTDAEIGGVQGVAGVVVTIVGTLAGGAVVARLGLRRSLWTFGVLHVVSNLGYFLLSRTQPDLAAMTCAILVENFCIGLATAGFLAFLMSQCDARFSAFQYALLTSLMAATKYVAGAPFGFLEERIGWTWFFAIAAASGLPSLLLIPWLVLPDDEPAT